MSLSVFTVLLSVQRLRQFRVNIREFTDANDDANKFKNRLANALPCKLFRSPVVHRHSTLSPPPSQLQPRPPANVSWCRRV